MLKGYARVSTQEQETHLQISALQRAGVELIFQEKRSGGDRKRPVLNEMLAGLAPGDTVLVFKLDRIARSLAHLLDILELIEKSGANFVSLTESIDTKSPSDRLMMQMIGAFAEFEREMIRERTRAGMRAAIERGVRMGRPFGIPEKLQLEAMRKWRSGRYSRTNIAREYGVHLSSVKRMIRRFNERQQQQVI